MKAVLLDVDGTLVDSNYHHVLSWQRAIVELGGYSPASVMHRFVGMGSDRFPRDAVSAEFEAMHGDEARELHRLYFEEMSEHRIGLPGVREFLEACRATNLTVVLASSSERGEIEQNLSVAGMYLDDVDGVVCGDDVPHSKPAPDVYQAALKLAGCEAHEAFAVGDTVWDAQATAEIDVPFVAVTTGGTTIDLLLDAGAHSVYNNVGEIARDMSNLLTKLGQ